MTHGLMLNRRTLVGLAGAGGIVAVAGCGRPRGTAYPARPLSFIIPYAPGGGFDSYARIAIAPMQRLLGKDVTIVPFNIEGAGGSKAAGQLFHAAPDGYTLGILSIPGAIMQQSLSGNGAYDVGQMTWLGIMGRDPDGIAVAYDSPIRSVADLRALSRRRPVKFTTTGLGSTGFASTLISSKMLDIPSSVIAAYKGTSESLVAAARGDGDASVSSLTGMTGLARAKVIRILATFDTKAHAPGMDDATTLSVPDLAKLAQFRTIAAPPGLPPALQQRLADALAGALEDPKVLAWAKKNHASVAYETPARTAEVMREQTAFITDWRNRLGGKW